MFSRRQVGPDLTQLELRLSFIFSYRRSSRARLAHETEKRCTRPLPWRPSASYGSLYDPADELEHFR